LTLPSDRTETAKKIGLLASLKWTGSLASCRLV